MNPPASTSVLWKRFSEWTSMILESSSLTRMLPPVVLGASLLLTLLLVLVVGLVPALVQFSDASSASGNWDRHREMWA